MSFLRRFGFVLFFSLCPFVCAQTPTDISAQLTFTTIDVPGSGFTGVEGINTAGDTVGYYGASSGGPFHSFLLSSGNFTFFDYPGASSTVATGINDSGLIVGYAGTVRVRGFSYNGTAFTSTRVGQNSATFTAGINNAGDIVGGTGSIYSTKGFEGRAGHFKRIGPPGTFVYIYGTGINNFGDVVGWTDYDGFVYSGGKAKTIRFPGSDLTEALGINDNHVIVGWYEMGGSVLGLALVNGHYTSFSYPGAKGTLPRGINSSGQIVGEYTTDFNSYHGFIATPIGPLDFSGSDCSEAPGICLRLEF